MRSPSLGSRPPVGAAPSILPVSRQTVSCLAVSCVDRPCVSGGAPSPSRRPLKSDDREWSRAESIAPRTRLVVCVTVSRVAGGGGRARGAFQWFDLHPPHLLGCVGSKGLPHALHHLAGGRSALQLRHPIRPGTSMVWNLTVPHLRPPGHGLMGAARGLLDAAAGPEIGFASRQMPLAIVCS